MVSLSLVHSFLGLEVRTNYKRVDVILIAGLKTIKSSLEPFSASDLILFEKSLYYDDLSRIFHVWDQILTSCFCRTKLSGNWMYALHFPNRTQYPRSDKKLTCYWHDVRSCWIYIISHLHLNPYMFWSCISNQAKHQSHAIKIFTLALHYTTIDFLIRIYLVVICTHILAVSC